LIEPSPAAVVLTPPPSSTDTRDSDAPLSRTRHSLAVRFTHLRRRHLFAFAGGGVLLGVLLTLVLLSGSDEGEPASTEPVAGQAPAAARVVENPPQKPREIVTPGPTATPNPIPTTNVLSLPREAESEASDSTSPRTTCR
jgi:hypothetical protein